MLTSGSVSGVAINFHPDFFCIHRHQKEVACNGVLFNNIYQPPLLSTSDKEFDDFMALVEQMRTEMQNGGLAQYELLGFPVKNIPYHRVEIKSEPTAGRKGKFANQ